MTNLEYIQTLNKTELACLICAIRNPYILCDCIADTKCEIIKTTQAGLTQRGVKRMSSILIKGMEMPERCLDCPMYDCYNYNCQLYAFGIPVRYNIDGSTRPKWCELVEVPTPHGRLIDADALDYKLGSSDRDIYVRGVLEEEAPTVIEAER